MTTNTITTNNETINKVAVLKEHNKIDNFEFFHYTVANMKAANYNAEFEIPEYYMIEREEVIAGMKHTFYKSYMDDCTAVKMENENWGISVSFYDKTGWTSEFLFEIKK